MSIKELRETLAIDGIRPETFSFYVDADGNDQPDTSFGVCDLSGERGALVGCRALNKDGEIVFLEVGEWLVGGHLGRLAGAF
jgi:hypothetical protein